MQRKSLQNKVVRVTWADAWQSAEYFDEEDTSLLDAKLVDSYGFVIKDDKIGIAIAMDDLRPNEDARFRDVKFIPRAMVRKVKVLR